jgi:beta-galactosidase
LKVVGRKDGKVAASASHHTAGAPARIAISADQSELDPANRDLSYVTIRVEDEDGRFAPKAAKWVNIQIEGPARLVGSGGGDPLSHTSFQANTFRTFNGIGLAIIAATSGPDKIRPGSTRKPGEIIVRANSKGMESVELRLIRTSTGMLQTNDNTPTPATGPTVDGVDGLPSEK